jgi:hypothetical protein
VPGGEHTPNVTQNTFGFGHTKITKKEYS